MSEALNSIKNYINDYYGDFVFLLMAIIAFCYLAVTSRELRGKLLFPIGLILFCIINPILYKFVFCNIIYWRLFWTIPDAIIIALAITKFIRNKKEAILQTILLIVSVVGIILLGNNAFKTSYYTKIDNWYKVPSEVAEVCDIILAIDENPRCIMPEDLFSDVRQYSGDIEMLYGRNVLDKYIINSNEASKGIYLELRNETPDYDYIFGMSYANNCNFLVLEDEVENEILVKYKYEKIASHKCGNIYYNSEIDIKEPGGWLISQYGKVDEFKRTYITLEDGNGGVIIIDGGTHHNSYNIRQLIKKYDNHVTAWIITNPHREYAEAFHRIIEEYKDIQIDNVYTISADKYDYTGQNVTYINEDDTFEIKGLKFGVDYFVINEKKDYAMMCIYIEANKDKITLRTSLNKSEKKNYEEKNNIMIPVFSERLIRSVIK